MTLTKMGTVYSYLDQQQKALEHLDQALAVWHVVGDRHLEAITLSIKGQGVPRDGRTPESARFYTLALPVMRAVGDQSGEAITFTQLGPV